MEAQIITLPDVGDPIDLNIYGGHPFYLDTRYYEVGSNGKLSIVTSDDVDLAADYVSYSHGLYSRNAHGQDILLRPTSITVSLSSVRDAHCSFTQPGKLLMSLRSLINSSFTVRLPKGAGVYFDRVSLI